MGAEASDESLDSKSRLLLLMLVAVWWLGSALTYPNLPALIPSHFNLSGVSDGPLREKTLWFVFPALGTACVLIVEVVLKAAARYPGLLNIPGKEEFLRMSDAEQAPVLVVVNILARFIAAGAILMMMVVQAGTYKIAVHGAASLPPLTIFAFGGFVMGSAVAIKLAVSRIEAIMAAVPRR